MSGIKIDGYVGESLYPSSFHMAFSPCWLDTILAHRGYVCPRAAEKCFSMLDLGCGDGLGLILLAATYPDSSFVGIDAMQAHINQGNGFISELGLTNVELRCQTFQDALSDPSIQADYISAQGVWSWISPENQNALLELVSQHLTETGVAVFGYNCLPGWQQIVPLQKLIHTLADGCAGAPEERVNQSINRVKQASRAGMAVIGEKQLAWLASIRSNVSENYIAHEYLNDHWQPFWSGDAIASAGQHGLQFLGSSLPTRLREDFVLKSAQRAQLAQVKDLPSRETMADLFLNCWFRTDIYSKRTSFSLPDEEQQLARLNGHWIASQPKDEVSYNYKTTAGTLKFDNPCAHHVLEQLETGPKSMQAVHDANHPGSIADLFNTIDSLFTANLVKPVDALQKSAIPEAVNNWLISKEKCGLSINAVATSHGPIAIERGQVAGRISDAGFCQRLGLKHPLDVQKNRAQ